MRVVCFGDSLTECGGVNGRYSDILQDRFPDHEFINTGVGGETFIEAKERLHRDVLALNPDVVLIEFGANDWWRNERPCEDWASDLEWCLSQITSAGATAIVLGVFGKRIDENGNYCEKEGGTDERGAKYRILEEETSRKFCCKYIPNIQAYICEDRNAWADQNHPNEFGNRSVADIIVPELQELLNCQAKPIRLPNLKTTLDFWTEAVALNPQGLAAADGSRRVSYEKANIITDKLAGGIWANAKSQKPRIAVYLQNSLEYYLIYWAVQKLGGAIIPLNTWLKEESLRGIFTTVEPDILFVSGATDTIPIQMAEECGVPVMSYQGSGSEFHLFTLNNGIAALAELADAPAVKPDPTDVSIIMHTSGTTSTPKGAIMRHCDLIFNVMAAINAHGFSPDDIHLLVNPMFHCTALYSSLPTAAYQKTPVIITKVSEPELLMDLVQKEKITTFLSVPTVFQKILAMPGLDKYNWSSLRVMAYAGSPMPVPVIKALREKFPGVSLHNFFGLTETISMTHVLRNDDVEEKADSIGKLLPFVYAIIVDNNDELVPPGVPGELLFNREEVISGYFRQPDRLSDAIAIINGKEWFRTGDLAAVDENGYFFIKGRKKDMIIVGGENVFAVEVEAILQSCPGVKEAAVKGVPATGVRIHLGELVKAYIVKENPNLTERDVKGHCFERLPSYKVPQIIVFVDTLPRNPAGKVVKDLLE